MRSEIGGVDSECVYRWDLEFRKFMRHVTEGGRKLLLTYDAYRLHVSLRVLEHFLSNNIIGYVLIAHTYRWTQPLDVVTLEAMKQMLPKLKQESIDIESSNSFDLFQIATLAMNLSQDSFAPTQIQNPFRHAGLSSRPLEIITHFSSSRADNDLQSRLDSVEEKKIMYMAKRRRLVMRFLAVI